MAPISHGKFSYDGDTFYVEASGNIHRRAIPAELRALFDASIPDRNQRLGHPAHWYEAQLLHYGLSPSKVKATAQMRLLDAIQDGLLEVPIELVQMEKRLKREWKKQEEAAHMLPLGLPILDTTITTTTKTIIPDPLVFSSSVPSKRGRDMEDCGEKERVSVKQTARRPGLGRSSLQSNIPPSTSSQSQEKQEPELANQARRRHATGNTVPRLQTARKGTVSTAEALREVSESNDLSGRIGRVGIQSSTSSSRGDREVHDYDDTYDEEYYGDSSDSFDDYDSPESNLPSNTTEMDDPFHNFYHSSASNTLGARSSSVSYADLHGPPPTYDQLFGSQPPQRCLGLLNGEYEISSNEPAGNLIHRNGVRVQPKICLTLNWDEMWGSIELGILEGIIWIAKRPKKASEEKIAFEWYGRASEQLFVGRENSGWIRFLGDGQIEGEISCFRRYTFVGQRISGEDASPPRKARDLRAEWEWFRNEVHPA
ncbi:DNA-repair protein UmuC-like N-terminal [Penicillium nucicola]|uniref:DNA-repair protein UmuC-like N-terminal n=1 Tax=Penicillium nucicola TaxID=1850975 RepID=UPI002544DCD3|nr:DNA-repair protein UmuC-like N-terminal [Penicillium nucicola]KAJ5776224.1 DNA-repair protein UmuC-like N-terminal [Penicillium nucicola]